MKPVQKLIARKMMKLRILESKGTAYQRLLERVMGFAHSDFTPIRPYGRVGDRKNDGYIRNLGLFYQVYAPERPEDATTEVAAAKKAAEDFAGLLEAWSEDTPVREYRFAYNDAYLGSPPPLEEALAKIRRDHSIEARAFLAKDLEDIALGLPDDQLFDLIGTVVLEEGHFDDVEFGVLAEVVQHVHSHHAPVSRESVLAAPDFEDKIKFNGLTPPIASLLRVGSFQSDAVADFFSMNSEFARQGLRNELNGLYLRSRERFAGQVEEDEADLVFLDLLDAMTPPSEQVTSQQALAQQAAIVVMAFYFEACDVFEGPDATA